MIIHQMDVVTVFLNGTINEEIYMEQSPGYIKRREKDLVCKLNKSIYGLKHNHPDAGTLSLSSTRNPSIL